MMDDGPLRISPPPATVRSLVRDKLREAIVSGRFKPGQRLVERELCELTGVSRASIREALGQLEAEGLVTIVPHRGPIVSETTYDEAVQLYQIRSLLEGFAGEHFAVNASEDQIAALGFLVDQFESLAKAPDANQLLDVKSQFYGLLIDGAGNIFLKRTLGLLNNRVQALRKTSMMQDGRLEHSVREIRDIFEAIQRRDSKRSGELCRLHVDNAARAALTYLAASRPPDEDTD
ncbi:MAG: GntR family transcriptional regulator [Devosia sp.]